jgi:hypothetical protein
MDAGDQQENPDDRPQAVEKLHRRWCNVSVNVGGLF